MDSAMRSWLAHAKHQQQQQRTASTATDPLTTAGRQDRSPDKVNV
jgi:hypothetical protein